MNTTRKGEAWRSDFSWDSRQLGVYYHVEVESEDVYVAYNMHWEEGAFALPGVPVKKRWNLAVSTNDGILVKEKYLEDQHRQVVAPRSIAVYVGEKSHEA